MSHQKIDSPRPDSDHHATSSNDDSKEVHVDPKRYKTKMCRNFLKDGVCPYETRCMFAHGPHELRTPDENIEDGLVTESAIKKHQQQLMYEARVAEAAAAMPNVPLPPPACSCPDCMAPTSTTAPIPPPVMHHTHAFPPYRSSSSEMDQQYDDNTAVSPYESGAPYSSMMMPPRGGYHPSYEGGYGHGGYGYCTCPDCMEPQYYQGYNSMYAPPPPPPSAYYPAMGYNDVYAP